MDDSIVILAAVITAVIGMAGLYLTSQKIEPGNSMMYGITNNVVIKGNLVSVRNTGKVQTLTVLEQRTRSVITFEPANFSRMIGEDVKITGESRKFRNRDQIIATRIRTEDGQ